MFDVVGEVFPSNLLDRLFRELYARRLDMPALEDRIVREVNPQRVRAITSSALEGLAKRGLTLSAMIGKPVEARERRLVPEVIEQFFVEASLRNGPLGKMELVGALGQEGTSGSLHQGVRDLVEKGLVERTIPDKPNSRLQRYRLTPAGEDARARSER